MLTSEVRVNFLGADGRFNLQQWFKGRVEIGDAPTFQNAMPTVFAGHEPV
jgi:hypothetical protein